MTYPVPLDYTSILLFFTEALCSVLFQIHVKVEPTRVFIYNIETVRPFSRSIS